MAYHVYILASRRRGAIYVGITSDLSRRVEEHRLGLGSRHIVKYQIFRLVYWETFENPNEAISFEKRLKRWRRPWKERLIEERNPEWRDLTSEICCATWAGTGESSSFRSVGTIRSETALRSIP